MKSFCLIYLCAVSLSLSAQTHPAPSAQAARDQADAQRASIDARQAEAAARAAEAAARSQSRSAQASAEMAEAQAKSAADQARSRRQTAPTEQEQLAIAALEGLMAAPSERALPLLKRVLDGPQTELVKMRALFVLSQIDNAEAQQLLLGLARKAQGELRLEAVRMIGIGGNQAALAALVDIYADGDANVRREVLNAYLIADRKTEVLQLARDAKNEDDARAAIQTLGAMDALAELRQLGELGKHSSALVQAYAIAGDLPSLRKLATSAESAELRVEATRSIGIVDSQESGAALSEIYRTSKDAQVRRAALDGLMISGDEKALLQIYRDSRNPEEKREVLRQLTIIGGDGALEAIDAALQGKAP